MDCDSDYWCELGDNDQSCVLHPLAQEGDEHPVGDGGADGQEDRHVGVLCEGQPVLDLPKEEENGLGTTTEELHETENPDHRDNPHVWTVLAGAE